MNLTELMDDVNRTAWRRNVRWFSRLEGWTDPGERVALERVVAEARGQPILDLGVGGGRTVPILREISESYVAIDYTPELVRACRAKYPGVDIQDGDARDLSRFASGTFALVVFSFNGIDAVSHDDRKLVLREVRRVLRPGGCLVFSTHNKHGPGHGEGTSFGVNWTRNPLRLSFRILRAISHIPNTLANRHRLGSVAVEHPDYSIRNAAAHDHGILVHYITLASQIAELADAGFLDQVEAYSSKDGALVAAGDDTHGIWWFHLLARVPIGHT